MLKFIRILSKDHVRHWLSRNVGNVSVLNHEGEPMDITQARVCTHANMQIYASEHLNLSQITINRKWK